MRLDPRVLYAALLLLPLCACEKQGPFERAGEEVDEAVQDVRHGGETTGHKVDDAIDDARDGVEDAKKDLKH